METYQGKEYIYAIPETDLKEGILEIPARDIEKTPYVMLYDVGRDRLVGIRKNDNKRFSESAETEKFFCLVVGSRGFHDYKFFSEKLDFMLSNQTNTAIYIVTGGCSSGADKMAEDYAVEHGYGLYIMHADWEHEGKSAGFKRNKLMHQYISTKEKRGCVMFWDGKSKGTAHSFELSQKYGNPVKCIKVKPAKGQEVQEDVLKEEIPENDFEEAIHWSEYLESLALKRPDGEYTEDCYCKGEKTLQFQVKEGIVIAAKCSRCKRNIIS